MLPRCLATIAMNATGGENMAEDFGIKPCPCCGGFAAPKVKTDGICIQCSECGIMTEPSFEHWIRKPSKAIKVWNQRQIEDDYIPYNERERIVKWLARFCRHIDNGDEWLDDEHNLAFFKAKMKQQFGWETDGITLD